MMKRLLLIDDEEAILFAFARYFSRCGFKVDCARELEEAEALAAHTPYDLVIADLCLSAAGSTEGLEIVRYIRLHCPRARVIVITAHDTPAMEREALRRGADAFVRKPRPLSEIASLAATLFGDAP
jgi:two-component system OmpR family response regulator